MKTTPMFAFGIVVIAATNLACSGSGRSVVAGSRCPENYNPVSKELVSTKAKPVKKVEINEALPEGTYEYQGARLFYKNPSGFMMAVADKRIESETEKGSKKVQFKAQTSCVRDGRKATEGLSVVAPGVSFMKVTATGVEVELKNYGFERMPDGRLRSKVAASEEKPTSIEQAYAAIPEKFIVSHAKDVYEIRSFEQLADGSSYALSVKFKRRDLQAE